MATTRIDNVRIAGLASCVPSTVITMEDDAQMFGEDEIRRVVKNTGVKRRHVSRALCLSDMSQTATERLLADLEWERDSVDAIVVVTQSGDYLTPGTACLMQDRLGLSKQCAAFDVNLGCSGYVYGLWMLGSFLSTGMMKRGLLIVGDTATRATSPHDRSILPLFGDAGCATALEFSEGAEPWHFVLGTDGSGGKHLTNRIGGYRHRYNAGSWEWKPGEDGVLRQAEHTYMNGAEVLTFALNSVPSLLQQIRAASGWSDETVDHYVFHQASAFMLKNIGRLCRIPPQKVPLGLENYGNTSSASIPLAMNSELREQLTTKKQNLLVAGFGIGWSWAAGTIPCGPIVMPEIVVMEDRDTGVGF